MNSVRSGDPDTRLEALEKKDDERVMSAAPSGRSFESKTVR